MVKNDQVVVMRAIGLCFKPFLKPEEALIYCNLGRTQFAKKCEEYGIYKNNSGYFKKEDVDKFMSGEPLNIKAAADKLKLKKVG